MLQLKQSRLLIYVLKELFDACKKNGYVMLITSDHGNADVMFNEKKLIQCTTHTTNPVPFIICSKNIKFKKNEGILADIAPTILDLMKLRNLMKWTGRH